MHEYTCATCPFWSKHPEDIEPRPPIPNLGRCYGDPPKIIMTPHVQNVDPRSAREILLNPDQRNAAQQQVVMIPEVVRPDILGTDPACHLHPETPANALATKHMHRAMAWLDKVEESQRVMEEAQARMIAGWNGDGKPN
jgi:hypothetical protein